MRKNVKKKKSATFDTLARMVQQGFEGVHSEISKLATKQELKEEVGLLRNDMEAGFQTLEYKLDQKIDRSGDALKGVKATVNDHEHRLTRTERKLHLAK